jgi:hypothetical protein
MEGEPKKSGGKDWVLTVEVRSEWGEVVEEQVNETSNE